MLVGVFRLGVRRADITDLLIVSLISSGIPGVEQRNTSFAVRQQADDAAMCATTRTNAKHAENCVHARVYVCYSDLP